MLRARRELWRAMRVCKCSLRSGGDVISAGHTSQSMQIPFQTSSEPSLQVLLVTAQSDSEKRKVVLCDNWVYADIEDGRCASLNRPPDISSRHIQGTSSTSLGHLTHLHLAPPDALSPLYTSPQRKISSSTIPTSSSPPRRSQMHLSADESRC